MIFSWFSRSSPMIKFKKTHTGIHYYKFIPAIQPLVMTKNWMWISGINYVLCVSFCNKCVFLIKGVYLQYNFDLLAFGLHQNVSVNVLCVRGIPKISEWNPRYLITAAGWWKKRITIFPGIKIANEIKTNNIFPNNLLSTFKWTAPYIFTFILFVFFSPGKIVFRLSLCAVVIKHLDSLLPFEASETHKTSATDTFKQCLSAYTLSTRNARGLDEKVHPLLKRNFSSKNDRMVFVMIYFQETKLTKQANTMVQNGSTKFDKEHSNTA